MRNLTTHGESECNGWTLTESKLHERGSVRHGQTGSHVWDARAPPAARKPRASDPLCGHRELDGRNAWLHVVCVEQPSRKRHVAYRAQHGLGRMRRVKLNTNNGPEASLENDTCASLSIHARKCATGLACRVIAAWAASHHQPFTRWGPRHSRRRRDGLHTIAVAAWAAHGRARRSDACRVIAAWAAPHQ